MDIVFFLFKTEISTKTPLVGDHRGLMMRSDVVDQAALQNFENDGPTLKKNVQNSGHVRKCKSAL